MPVYLAGCAVAGLLFGVLTTALDGDWGSPVGFLVSALVRGTLWGVPFGLVMFVIGRRARRRADLKPELSSPRFGQTVRLPSSTDIAEAFDSALEATRDLSKGECDQGRSCRWGH